jgi:hypothetical protein
MILAVDESVPTFIAIVFAFQMNNNCIYSELCNRLMTGTEGKSILYYDGSRKMRKGTYQWLK